MRSVVFDLDGTLADTAADLIAAANACFREFGHDVVIDPVADARTAYRGGRALLRLGYARLGIEDDGRADTGYPQFLKHYVAHDDAHARLYPGVVEAVERLRADGYATAVCTNKTEAMAVRLLKRLGVFELFGAVIGADTLPTKKPDPAPYRAAVEQAGGLVARSYLLGDTETDRATARAAGVPCALVTFGPDGEAVAGYDPDGLLASFDELANLTRRLIG